MNEAHDVWYFAKGSQRFGPVTLAELRARKATGELQADDFVWRAGEPSWRRAAEFADLAPFAATAPRQGFEPPGGVYPGAGEDIPNYLWQSIVVTILCCFVPGIPAIVYASRVDRLLTVGDVRGARAASDSAKTWCILALISGVLTCGALSVLNMGNG